MFTVIRRNELKLPGAVRVKKFVPTCLTWGAVSASKRTTLKRLGECVGHKELQSMGEALIRFDLEGVIPALPAKDVVRYSSQLWIYTVQRSQLLERQAR